MCSALKHLMLIIVMNHLYHHTLFAYPAGLPIPTWYKADLRLIDVPEFGQDFKAEFELQNLVGDLSNVHITIQIPTGLKLVNGQSAINQKLIKKNEISKWTWTFNTNRDILGESIQLTLKTDYPQEEIKKTALANYAPEAKHQLEQLLKKINDINDRVSLHFQTNIYCLRTEGFTKMPQYIFARSWKPADFANSFLMLDYKDSRNPNKELLMQEITQMDKYIENLNNDTDKSKNLTVHRPHAYKRVLEDNLFKHYAVAMMEFNAGNFIDCDRWLQKMSLLILKEEDLNSDLFLSVQNTRAMCAIALQRVKEALKILRTSVQTELNASVRYYLLYNLAIIMEHENNKPQMTHYLNQSLAINPTFSSAKKLLKDILKE